MAVIAKWGPMQWEVSSKRIAALNGLSTAVELDTENSDDKAGSPATKTKALRLQTFMFEFTLSTVVGCDVRGEYEQWTELIGAKNPFYLGGKRFGPENLQLTAVAMNDAQVDDFGRIAMATISITLVEYAQEASKKKSSSKKAAESSPATSTDVGSRLSAIDVGADATAKENNNPYAIDTSNTSATIVDNAKYNNAYAYKNTHRYAK